MIVPVDALDPETLVNLIEEFVTRDGTDYGETEVPVAARVAQVRRQLETGQASLWFDAATETVTVLAREDLPPT